MNEAKFKVGDQVKLKSGGPTMTVAQTLLNFKTVVCRWMIGNDLKTIGLHEDELTFVESKKIVSIDERMMRIEDSSFFLHLPDGRELHLDYNSKTEELQARFINYEFESLQMATFQKNKIIMEQGFCDEGKYHWSEIKEFNLVTRKK